MNKHKICSCPRTQKIILYSIFFVTVLPCIWVYLDHAYVEQMAFEKSILNGNEYKATKQSGEAFLFYAIAGSYVLTAGLITVKPKWIAPYLVILIGTVIVVTVYFFRIYGIPVLGTDVIIRDLTTDWRDVVTKICQQILVIPVAILMAKRKQLNY